MQKPPTPIDETQRLRALHSLKILDTAEEERFDRITRLATRLFNVPVALVSLVDQKRQWFKSRQGLEACETGRDVSFCGHAILHEGPLVVEDALGDPRFSDNPLVIGAPHIRFYAGHPVHAPDGARIGTLCIIDRVPRTLSAEDVIALADLAGMVDREVSLLRLATIDELTHLSNRRGFTEVAQHLLGLCRRHAQPATLVAIDLDGFKAINDTLGHGAGDHVLRAFATLLLKHFRASDLVARLGGDEFCVLASDATETAIGASLARFAAGYASSELAAEHAGLSWSIGMAEFDPASDVGIEELLLKADRNMYASKGRRATQR
jgi:diguanylate cyclase (GGDEF)-like protein